MGTQQKKFVGLDGMRGFAALAVMAFHYRDHFVLPFSIVSNGETAVDLFFVLSGFVLAHAYERRFAEGLGTARFMALRLGRIYPLYLMGTALAILADLILWESGYWAHPAPALAKAEDYAIGLLFIPWFCTHCAFFAFNFPAWSLLIELIANFFYRIFFKVLSAPVLSVLAITCLVGLTQTNAQNVVGYEGMVQDLFRIGFSFPVGVLLFRYWSTGRFVPRVPTPLPIAGILILFFLPDTDASHLISLASFPILIYLAASSEPRGIKAELYSRLGAISFAVYMLHMPVLDFYKILEHKIPVNAVTPAVPFALLMVTVVGLAFQADRKYDVSLQKLIRQTVGRPHRVAIAGEGKLA